ncbi:MAG TPA: hypothetical protein VFZ13_01130 [Gemmatimonadales bacterium]
MTSRVSPVGWAALAGFLLVLPLAIMEVANGNVGGDTSVDLAPLFGLLWLLPTTAIGALAQLIQEARTADRRTVPFRLILHGAVAAVAATLWVLLVSDQMPCFLGVPNCD